MRILGIDTSLTGTGLARIDVAPAPPGAVPADVAMAWEIDTATVGAPKPTKDKSKRAMVRRVDALLAQIAPAFEGVDAVGLEGLAYGAKGEGAWVLPWIWGEVIRMVDRADVPLTIVATSARAKFATGKGNADKETVLLAAAKLMPEADILNNNEADAAIVAAVVCQQHGLPVLPVTNYRTEVMDGLGN